MPRLEIYASKSAIWRKLDAQDHHSTAPRPVRRKKHIVFRVQDFEGRGPYRPGFSHFWADKEGPVHLPPWEEFGKDWLKGWREGDSIGFGFRTLEQLHRWFSPSELVRLDTHGHRIVSISADRILCESPNQLVFTCRKPLARATLPIHCCAAAPFSPPLEDGPRA